MIITVTIIDQQQRNERLMPSFDTYIGAYSLNFEKIEIIILIHKTNDWRIEQYRS